MYDGGPDGAGEGRQLKNSGRMTTTEKRNEEVSGELRAAVPLPFQHLSLPLAEL